MASASEVSLPVVEHLLLTRLSVRLDDEAATPPDAWLRGRLDLFTTVCAPSVNGQVLPFDRWLLFFDESTPDWFVDACRALVAVPHEVVRMSEVWSPAAVARAVASRSAARFLITSRLDSDDAVARTYAQTVRSRFTQQSYAFINLLQGAQWSRSGLATYSHPSNAFISCVEEVGPGGPKTVFVDWHDRVGRLAPLEQVRGTPPMWMQGVHEGNLLNGESGWPVRPDVVLAHFDVELDGSLHERSAAGLVVARVRAVGRLAARIAARPSRLRWVPRYLLARTRRSKGTR
jgi:hypothetical protein